LTVMSVRSLGVCTRLPGTMRTSVVFMRPILCWRRGTLPLGG
jgi:hypothetical protein